MGLKPNAVSFDFVQRADVNDFRFGAETWIFDGKFAVRAGARMQEVTLGLGYDINLGADNRLIIDYAFGWPLEVEETIGSHRMGVTLRF